MALKTTDSVFELGGAVITGGMSYCDREDQECGSVQLAPWRQTEDKLQLILHDPFGS